ncbi:FadR/GntR family transcriptional regulator [Alysiella filiformis]|uniref:DNA-binding transcriptional regulator, FadR family n=1 Tax=Alysiella filiformis DSM 16848 TaxID=1120981 RepID=A0A286E1M0_9NEIS|nr:FadR/GntR family transcriptional regulator [Alysiella filiformis]QMT30759.1 FadR family transcriptional regulator [Alysiella filiformis]UBQ56261.1 FadR family transcriptional regulator [Alysiella filiformis DSM 16848]SOD64783.1 DNA-binding transcriptional regulator, FadR family [Alysiella filiformis DSM 16848]
MQAESLIPSDAPPRLYQKIANLLREKITQGEWQAGDTLPSERDLAKWLNVSRTSVREAIIALEVSGWLEVKVGKGVYVCQQKENQNIDLNGISPFSLLQARLLIEPETAALAAENMTEKSLFLIKQAYLMNVSDNIMGSTTHDGDRLFHIRIAESCGNDVYPLILKKLLNEQSSKLFSALRRLYTPSDMPLRSQQEHYAILMALEQRDVNAARENMRVHLQNVIDIFMRGKEQNL